MQRYVVHAESRKVVSYVSKLFEREMTYGDVA